MAFTLLSLAACKHFLKFLSHFAATFSHWASQCAAPSRCARSPSSELLSATVEKCDYHYVWSRMQPNPREELVSFERVSSIYAGVQGSAGRNSDRDD